MTFLISKLNYLYGYILPCRRGRTLKLFWETIKQKQEGPLTSIKALAVLGGLCARSSAAMRKLVSG